MELEKLTYIAGVVDDARQNFGPSPSPPPVDREPGTPPLSPPPGRLSPAQSRSQRSARLPRRVPAANQIFANDVDGLSPHSSYVTSGYDTTIGGSGSTSASSPVPVIYTPSSSMHRRNTLSTDSHILDTPLGRRGKSRSHDLLRVSPNISLDLGSELIWKLPSG